MLSSIGLTNDILTTILIFVCTLIVVLYWFRSSRLRRPPGPYGLPFVGYYPFLTKEPHKKFLELKKKYGPVFSLRLGCRDVVVLCSYQSVKEAFSQDAFLGRPTELSFELYKETIKCGAINGSGWKEQRRFSMHLLRDLGFGKTRMEEHIKDEICDLLELIEKMKGKPFFPRMLLVPSLVNNISSLVFGRRRLQDDPKRMVLDVMMRDIGRLLGQTAWYTYFPWLRAVAVFLGLPNNKQLANAFRDMKQHIREEIDEHNETLNPNNIRDYIDGYLLEIEKRKTIPGSTFNISVLVDHVRSLFGAGSATIRTTVEWLLLVASSMPDVQKRVQSEIDEVIGRERFPTRADHKRMPYTEAVILEVMRWRTIIPINLMRYTMENAVVNSYFIPKNTYVMANFWATHHDPSLWGKDAEEFRPERFLIENQQIVLKPEYFTPFSVGKRACPGEVLAHVEVFLYFTAILQKFDLHLSKGSVPNYEGELGLALRTKPYQMCAEIRN